MPVKAGYLILTAAGGIVLYSGIKGKQMSSVLRDLVSGHAPGTAKAANALSNPANTPNFTGGSVTQFITGNTPSGTTVATYKAYAQTLLIQHGWPGQFSAFNNIEIAEAGWDNQAKNPSTGAYGIAQALGHGTAATVGSNGENNYGNYGTPDAVCKAANNGSGTAQVQWMMNYIAETYGTPNAAWAFHEANGWY